MQSAKSKIVIRDRSVMISPSSGVTAGFVVTTDKGEVNRPTKITSINQAVQQYGLPREDDIGYLSALKYLESSNSVYLVRASGTNTKVASALIASTTANGVKAITPHLGLDKHEREAFNFPTALSTRTYKTDKKIFVIGKDKTNTKIQVSDGADLSKEMYISFGAESQTTPAYKIEGIETQLRLTAVITLDKEVKVTAGEKLNKYMPTAPSDVFILSSGISKSVIVSNHDLVARGDIFNGKDKSNNNVSAKLDSKTVKDIQTTYVILDKPVDPTVTIGTKLNRVEQYEVTEPYCLLVTAKNEGDWGNNIQIAVEEVIGYNPEDYVYQLVIFDDGEEMERFTVSNKDKFIDDFGNNLNVEFVINTQSRYINVKRNMNNIKMPVYTKTSLWQRNPDPIYKPTNKYTKETIFAGDTEFRVEKGHGVSIGDRIRLRAVPSPVKGKEFTLNEDDDQLSYVSAEYTVKSVDEANAGYSRIFVNRPLREMKFLAGAELLKFFSNYNDPANDIVNGEKTYKDTIISKIVVGVKNPNNFKVGKYYGTLKDSGAKYLAGGDNGNKVELGGMVEALLTLSDPNTTKLTMIHDSGYTNPIYAGKVLQIAESQRCHSFLTISKEAELSVNYLDAIKGYKDSTGIDSSLASFFVGWLKEFNSLTKSVVEIPLSVIAMGLQSITTANGEYRPASGLNRGKFVTNQMIKAYNEADRDFLVDERMNPFIFRDGTYALWGNETSLRKPSPLQMRHIAFLIQFIEEDINSFIDYNLFEFNEPTTWHKVEGILNTLLRDKYKAKRAIYDYKVAVEEIITDFDIDQRRMPVFVGIQPTSDINYIPVRINIFNKSLQITVE